MCILFFKQYITQNSNFIYIDLIIQPCQGHSLEVYKQKSQHSELQTLLNFWVQQAQTRWRLLWYNVGSGENCGLIFDYFNQLKQGVETVSALTCRSVGSVVGCGSAASIATAHMLKSRLGCDSEALVTLFGWPSARHYSVRVRHWYQPICQIYGVYIVRI